MGEEGTKCVSSISWDVAGRANPVESTANRKSVTSGVYSFVYHVTQQREVYSDGD